MKDILKIVIPIIIVAVITFVLCLVFIKPKVLSLKETKFWCSDSDKYLEFYFKDGTYKGIHFQCEYLVYDGINYELKDKVILVDKDVYIPDKITKGMIIVSDEDKIDCK